jgi:hypothetical protein
MSVHPKSAQSHTYHRKTTVHVLPLLSNSSLAKSVWSKNDQKQSSSSLDTDIIDADRAEPLTTAFPHALRRVETEYITIV